MGFYYISIFGMFPLAIAYVVLFLIFWGITHLMPRMPVRKGLLAVIGVVFLILPVAEELWIAWNFGQACEEAGTFISKKVVVDGFYDGTGVSLNLVQPGGFRFVEGPRRGGGVQRVMVGDKEFTKEALRRFQEENPGRDPGTQDIVRVKLDNKTEALVYPRIGNSWRIEYLEQPTARYHYRSRNHIPVSLKVVKHESAVVDTREERIIGRETIIGRYAPWFFIGLDAPQMQCYGERKVKGLIYQNVLLPM